jgi:hypothetical protein
LPKSVRVGFVLPVATIACYLQHGQPIYTSRSANSSGLANGASLLTAFKQKSSPYATAQKASKLQARIKEIQQSLECPCPSKYKLKCHIDGGNFEAEIRGEIIQAGEIVRDNDRLEILRKRRADKKI